MMSLRLEKNQKPLFSQTLHDRMETADELWNRMREVLSGKRSLVACIFFLGRRSSYVTESSERALALGGGTTHPNCYGTRIREAQAEFTQLKERQTTVTSVRTWTIFFAFVIFSPCCVREKNIASD